MRPLHSTTTTPPLMSFQRLWQTLQECHVNGATEEAFLWWHCGFLCLRNTASLEILAEELITGDFSFPSIEFGSACHCLKKKKKVQARGHPSLCYSLDWDHILMVGLCTLWFWFSFSIKTILMMFHRLVFFALQSWCHTHHVVHVGSSLWPNCQGVLVLLNKLWFMFWLQAFPRTASLNARRPVFQLAGWN